MARQLLCKVKICERPARVKGLCMAHYMRIRQYGRLDESKPLRELVRGKTRSLKYIGKPTILMPRFRDAHKPAYGSWASMKSRCSNPKATGYDNYGGRGIKVCKGLLDFADFYAVMGDRPKGTTLDREHNDGNYSCGKCEECLENVWILNVRWATWHTQASNRRPAKPRTRSKNKNGYRCIYPKTKSNKWYARIMHNYTRINSILVDSAEEAAWMYDQIALSIWEDKACLNFEYERLNGRGSTYEPNPYDRGPNRYQDAQDRLNSYIDDGIDVDAALYALNF